MAAGCLSGCTGLPRRPSRSLGSYGRGWLPDQVSLEFGLKVSGEVNWWFFAKSQAEGTIRVTLTWAEGQAAVPAATDEDIADGG